MVMRTRWSKVLVPVSAATVVVGAAPLEQASAAAPPVPASVVLTPLDANAGWFQATGVCPAKTAYFSYKWTNASNGEGWGYISRGSGAFTLNLRMLASGPGQEIVVSLRCNKANGRPAAAFDPITTASGVDLIAMPPSDSGTGRRIVYSVSAQQLWVFEADETLVKSHLVSGRRLSIGGRRAQTGTFKVWLKRPRGACHGGCPFFVGFRSGYDRTEVIGFHQIPFNKNGPYETESELGQPRSHGCVRQTRDNAIWLYNWSQFGDKVVVIP